MNYDLIIIGGSAAGITAGIYASRRRLKFLIITRDFGGEVITSGVIENWPGIENIDGFDLAKQFKAHLDSYKPEIVERPVTEIKKQADGSFAVKTDDAKEFFAKSVIVATGVHPKELNIPGEKEYRLKGVSYCTTCDGPLFAGKTVAVIGGGNSALESALMLADLCPKVYLINKNPKFKGEAILVEKAQANPKIEVIYEALTSEIVGNGTVATGLKYKDKQGAEHELKMDGAFVHIGQLPNSGIVPAEVEKDKFGYISVDANCQTTVPGIFAAGDVTNVPFHQIVIAAGQGCTATLAVVQYLNRL